MAEQTPKRTCGECKWISDTRWGFWYYCMTRRPPWRIPVGEGDPACDRFTPKEGKDG